MIKNRRPETLYEGAVRRENERHTARLKQLVTHKKRLDAISAHLPGLKAAGVELYPEEITFYAASREIQLFPGFFNSRKTLAAIAYFTGQGFKEVDRSTYSSYDHVCIAKGTLRLAFDVDQNAMAKAMAAAKAKVEQAAPEATTAEQTGAAIPA